MKRVGLLMCVRNEGEDAVSAPLTQQEVRALRAYLAQYEFFISNAAEIGYDADEGAIQGERK